MDSSKLTVGKMARLNHISEQTLRLYDREGLLHPLSTDPNTGYRYYHIVQSARLDMIQYMKAYGMTLQQIKALLDNRDMEAVKEVLLRRGAEIDGQINNLQRSKRAISRMLQNYRRYEALPKDGRIFYEYMPPRRIYRYASEKNFFDQDYAGYEFMLRELKEHLISNDIPITYFCNVGTIMRRDALLSRRFYANEVFLFVEDEEDGEYLDEGLYCCLCADDFYQESPCALRLLAAVHESGCRVCGDYVCEVIMDFPAFDADRTRMFYKLQVPVEPEKTGKTGD